jgi:hypothetical protein
MATMNASIENTRLSVEAERRCATCYKTLVRFGDVPVNGVQIIIDGGSFHE